MRQFGRLIIGGIENKIFNLVLVTAFIIVIVIGAVTYYQSDKLTKLTEETNAKQQESMVGIANQTMSTVINNTMTESTLLKAYIADDLFSELETQVRMLGDYAYKLLKDPDCFPQIDVKVANQKNEGIVTAQLMYAKGVNITDQDTVNKIGVLGNLSDMMCSMYQSANLNSAFISTNDGITIIADDRPSSKYGSDGKPIRIDPTERPWYIGAAEKGDIYFSDIETDSFTGKSGIVCALPVYVNDELAAVVGADLFLDNMEVAVDNSKETSGFLFVVNSDGHIVFSPEKTGIFAVRSIEQATDLRKNENTEFATFIQDALKGNTDVRLINVDGKDYYLCGSSMNTVGWAVISVVDKEVTDSPAKNMEESYKKILGEAVDSYTESLDKSKLTVTILLIVVLLLAIVNAIVLAKKIVKPINVMAEKVSEINGDNLDFEMEKVYKTGDEIEVLAESFSALSLKTKEYIKEITRVTAEKERIGAELNVATQIQADMLPRIFPPFPDRKEFDLFASMNPAKEVGGDFYDYFLVDDDHIALIMADVSGKGVPAALFMVITKTLIKNRAQMGGSVSEILSEVNNQLCEGNEAEMFVTVWMAIIEISTGKGVAANAGHEHPSIRHKGGAFELAEYRHSPALAVMEGIPFRQHEFELKPGDTLFVYTDGVAEATDSKNELFGAERMLKSLNREPDAEPKKILENVMASIEDFVEDAPQFDDITMLCFKYYGKEQEV
ncbi:MAG: SpoIIE family protein phosphatase [Lachnospiraceae bacterium]|nr:SpoIIE family protein phosphatase [Lachnospiraceae bacterium]